MTAIIIILIIAAAIFVLMSLGALAAYRMSYRRGTGYLTPYKARYDYYEKDCPRQPVSFTNDMGVKLNGHVYTAKLPDGEPKKGLMVLVNGIWSVPEEYIVLIRHFQEEGYDVFTYCAGGYGESEGKDLIGLYRSPHDLDSALSYIRASGQWEGLPTVLIGHSWGAYAVTAVLNFRDDVTAVCSMSGFDTPYEVTKDVLKVKGKIGMIVWPQARMLLREKSGKDDLLSAKDGINRVNIPVLITHGINDDFIRYDVTSIISKRGKITNPKVEYLTLTEPGRSEHDTFFASKESAAYNAETEKRFNQFRIKCGGIVSDEKLREFMADIDFEKAGQPNEEFIAAIDDFFDRAIAERG